MPRPLSSKDGPCEKVTVYLPERLTNWLRHYAARRGLTQSRVIRRLLEAHRASQTNTPTP